MKSIAKYVALSLFLCAFVLPSFAQKKGKNVSEAHVKYLMTAEGGMAAAMSGTTMDLYFTPDNAKVIANIMNGMVKMDVRIDNKKASGIMLMDMMGQKKYVEMGEDDIKKNKEKNQKPTSVEYTKKFKKIAGYKCQEAIVQMDGLSEPATVYITEQIQPANLTDVSMMQFTGLKGFPLSWEIKQEGMTVKMEATAVSLDKLSKKLFNMSVPEGYQKMTMEELQGLGGTFGM